MVFGSDIKKIKAWMNENSLNMGHPAAMLDGFVKCYLSRHGGTDSFQGNPRSGSVFEATLSVHGQERKN